MNVLFRPPLVGIYGKYRRSVYITFGSTKPGLWTLDWTVDWTLDSVMAQYLGVRGHANYSAAKF